MNRLVYLFELDSVRNSPAEIRAGQGALFEELVFNGNKVVLTFNQITDSTAFLSILQDDKAFQEILTLFRMGVILVSPYGVRTASQYLQKALAKNLENDNAGFVFSGVPVERSDKDLIREMIEILQSGDIASMKQKYMSARDEGEKKKLGYLYRYIKLILTLSVENLEGPEQRTDPGRDLNSILEETCQRYSIRNFEYVDKDGQDLEKLRKEAVSCLIKCRKKELVPNRRSSWIDLLEKMRTEENTGAVSLAVMIVHLCYNYSIEESIPGVSHHYLVGDKESFYQDLEIRLQQYWESLQSGKSQEYKDNGTDWSLAVRVLERCRAFDKEYGGEQTTDNESSDIQPYEKNYDQEKRSWKKKLSGSARRYILYLLACGVSFLLATYLSDLLDMVIEAVVVMEQPFLQGLIYVTRFILIAVAGSVLLMVCKVPDILDTFSEWVQYQKDRRVLKRMEKDRAYINHENLKRYRG